MKAHFVKSIITEKMATTNSTPEPTFVTKNGKKIFYLDKNDKLIKIGNTVKVFANSGRNYGAIKIGVGILTDIKNGHFIINSDQFNVNAKCLYMKGGPDEIWHKCHNHETNGHTYTAEIIKD